MPEGTSSGLNGYFWEKNRARLAQASQSPNALVIRKIDTVRRDGNLHIIIPVGSGV